MIVSPYHSVNVGPSITIPQTTYHLLKGVTEKPSSTLDSFFNDLAHRFPALRDTVGRFERPTSILTDGETVRDWIHKAGSINKLYAQRLEYLILKVAMGGSPPSDQLKKSLVSSFYF